LDRTVFLLSPLAWWSDPFVNFPVAWILASLAAKPFPAAYGPALFILYWCTVLVGHLGMRASSRRATAAERKERGLWLPPIFYTVIIAAFLALRVLEPLA
jgi:hypothetical protein